MSAATPMTRRTRRESCTTSTGRTSSTPTASSGRLSVAVHRMAALRASRPGQGPRPAGADPDQPHDAQQAVRRSNSRPTRKRPIISPRAPSRSRRSGRPKTSWSTPSGESSTSSSSAAIPASNGASTRPSSTSRSPRGSRRGPTPTTAISPTRSRRCRPRATPRCSSGCSTIR